ncbi:MAG: HAMP domain-containing protein [Deltaproteobacteria bacterium]|nr:HAMP domain-containing protein [Deltaproteobacteria bacterium]
MKVFKFIQQLLESFDPQKSLKNTLTVWFTLFALVPLLVIVGYSAHLFNQRMNEELVKRLTAFEQGIDLELNDVEEKLRLGGFRHANDYYLINLIRGQKKSVLESVTQSIIENYITDRISYFNAKGKLILSVLPKRIVNNPEVLLPEEVLQLPQEMLTELSEKRQLVTKTAHTNIGFALDCFTNIRLGGKLVGFIKETIVLGRSYALSTKERTGLDIGILDINYKLLGSTLLPEQEQKFYYPRHKYEKISSLTLVSDSYMMLTKPLVDENEKPTGYLAILVSQATTQQTLKEIRNIFVLICAGITIIVILFTRIASQTVLRPIDRLLAAIKDIEKGKLDSTVAVPPMQEIATLIHSFNAMSSSLKSTQAQLIHSSKMTSLGQLVAGVAHELNNPIGYTYSNLSHLKEYIECIKKLITLYEETLSKLPKASQAHLQEKKKELNTDFILKDIENIIQSSLEGTQRTKDIVLGLRNFSRLDEAEIKEVDLHEGLENTLKLLNSEFKNRITLHKEYAKLPKVTCYPSQINQVFMNLLTNAIQAIEGPGEVWVKTQLQKDQVVISIRDSGKGIPQEHLDRIFDPFFTTKKIGQGTGLGLSISYGIIQKHKGEIKVTSTPSKGSTFTILLPKAGIAKV